MDVENNLAKILGVHAKIRKIKIDKYNINYLEAGSGEPLILLHGINIGWGQWYPNIKEFAKHFKVYAIDIPGSGKSSRINNSSSQLQDECVEVIKKFIHLNKLQRINLLGHSFGAFLALKVLLDDQTIVNKVILVNPMGFTRFIPVQSRIITFYPLAKLISLTVMRINKENIKKFLHSAFRSTTDLKEEFIDYYHDSLTKGRVLHPLLFMHSLTRGFQIKKEIFIIDQLIHIRKPVLILFGDKDPIIPLDKVYKAFNLIPNVEVKILHETGHVPSLENSTNFNKTVIDFLLRHRS